MYSCMPMHGRYCAFCIHKCAAYRDSENAHVLLLNNQRSIADKLTQRYLLALAAAVVRTCQKQQTGLMALPMKAKIQEVH